MSNLTFDEKLIREHRAEPLEGHTVVVLERVGESGEKFHSLLEPGDDRPRQGLIAFLRGKPSVYFAFAVDASKHRLLSFSAPVQMAEHAHDFELHFSLWHRVSDAQLLVATRAADPLALVRQNVIEVVTEEVAELPWADVWHSFRAASDSVVAGTLSTIKSFARDHGIAVNSLRLRAKFPDSAVAVDRRIHRVRERGRLGRERADVARELQNHKRGQRREDAALEEEERRLTAWQERQDRVTRATTDKYVELIGGASSAVELGDVYNALSVPSAGGVFGIQVHNGSNGSHAVGPGSPAPAALPPGGSGLPAVLADLVTLTQALTDVQRRRVRGILLHVVAAAVADDSSQVSPVLADFARRARGEIDAAADLPASHAHALQAMADPQQLHQRLYP